MLHPWPSTDPASVAMSFETGAGPTTTLAAAAAWAVEAAMHDMSMVMSGINIASLLPNFIGVGGTASAATGGMLNGLQGALGGHCLKQQLLMLAAAELYSATRAGLIPSVVVDANRVECAADIIANPATLGALTGRIAELEGEYVEYWGQNSGLGANYGTTLNALAAELATVPPPAAMGANPAAPAMAATSVGESAATNTATATARATSKAATTGMEGVGSSGGMDQMVGQMGSMLSGAVQPLTGMFQAVPSAFQSLAGLPQSAMGSLTGLMGGMKPTGAAVEAAPAMDAMRTAPGAGAGGGLGGAGGGGGGVPASGMSGLTNYTRPTSSFAPEGGRATGLRPGLLNAAEVAAPTGPTQAGGSGMPMSPAGMLGRDQGEGDKKDVQHARIVMDDNYRDER
ncbi:MAG: PPE domain-containing protein [Mycobacterium sp.]|nr:PPE domain-containing protein [Mycobacterium sp.]